MAPLTKTLLNPKNLIIVLALLLCGYNLFYLGIYAGQKYRDKTVYLEPGSQFETFAPHLVGVEKIGYLTDKDLSREKNDGTYLQAQYYLAPVVIDPKKTHQYNIIDATNMAYIVQTLRETRGKRLTYNSYGQALIKGRP